MPTIKLKLDLEVNPLFGWSSVRIINPLGIIKIFGSVERIDGLNYVFLIIVTRPLTVIIERTISAFHSAT